MGLCAFIRQWQSLKHPRLLTFSWKSLLLEIGCRASLKGGNPYKAKAYIRAAESLRSVVTPLGEIIRRSELRAIPGIGDAIARRITELRDKGTDEGLERLRRKFPASLLDLLSIPRLKPSAANDAP
jgi:DNA polymerase (family X)